MIINNIEITDDSYPGKGIGFYNNKIIFVENAIKGDIIDISVIKEENNFIEGNIYKFHKKSKFRNSGTCPYGNKCGGCNWNDIEYSYQLSAKKRHTEELLLKIGKIEQNIEITGKTPVIPYRIRARFHYSQNQFGFFKEHSNKITEIENCPVCYNEINESYNSIKTKILSSKLLFDDFDIEFRYSPFEKNVSYKIITNNKNNFDSLIKVVGKSIKYQKFHILDSTISLNINSFVQINFIENKRVINEISQFIKEVKPKRVLDLYGGFGNLSLPAIDYLNKLTIVENNKFSINDGKKFVKDNNLHKKVKYIKSDTSKIIKGIGKFNLVIIDPPRAGAKAVVKNIEFLEPDYIIYLSCNPATFSRDAALLTQKGYKLTGSKLYDFFPNTYHIELLSFFEKSL